MVLGMKKKTPRDEKYLAWIRKQPCLVSGSEYDVIAHHVRHGNPCGMGLKPSDYRCIPLRADIHVNLHSWRNGEADWYLFHGIQPAKSILTLLVQYAAENGFSSLMMDHIESFLENQKNA